MIFFQDTNENTITEVIEDIGLKFPYRVILFNDDWHTFDEVIIQLIKALKCSVQKAKALTLKAHYEGKAVVFEGELSRCLVVSSILEEIKLMTQIES